MGISAWVRRQKTKLGKLLGEDEVLGMIARQVVDDYTEEQVVDLLGSLRARGYVHAIGSGVVVGVRVGEGQSAAATMRSMRGFVQALGKCVEHVLRHGGPLPAGKPPSS